MSTPSSTSFQDLLQRKIIFVTGKGGVGKTVVSRAIAMKLAQQGLQTVWITFEDPLAQPGEKRSIGPKLTHLNCEAEHAFEEYISLKLNFGPLTKLFVNNKLIKYLSKAAPGMHDLVLLGQVWHERENFSRVVVDMPSTGYALAMFNAALNYSKLFRGGPIHKDADAMLETFGTAATTSHLVVAIPEEMPLRESLDLDRSLSELFPKNRAQFLVNRKFPHALTTEMSQHPVSDWADPVSRSAEEYIDRRTLLEQQNLKIWTEAKIQPFELPLVPMRPEDTSWDLSRKLAEVLPS